jgi:hypothetical protein
MITTGIITTTATTTLTTYANATSAAAVTATATICRRILKCCECAQAPATLRTPGQGGPCRVPRAATLLVGSPSPGPIRLRADVAGVIAGHLTSYQRHQASASPSLEPLDVVKDCQVSEPYRRRAATLLPPGDRIIHGDLVRHNGHDYRLVVEAGVEKPCTAAAIIDGIGDRRQNGEDEEARHRSRSCQAGGVSSRVPSVARATYSTLKSSGSSGCCVGARDSSVPPSLSRSHAAFSASVAAPKSLTVSWARSACAAVSRSWFQYSAPPSTPATDGLNTGGPSAFTSSSSDGLPPRVPRSRFCRLKGRQNATPPRYPG